MTQPHYKLTYFNLRALGEHIRFMFVAAGVEFEDFKIPYDNWVEWKPKIKFGQLPVLEVDGKELSQSFAIARFLAKSFKKFEIEDAFGAAKADEVADFLTELRLEFRIWFLCKDTAEKEVLMTKLTQETFPRYLNIMETVALDGCKANGKFLGGQQPSWQDFFVANFLEIFGEFVFPEQNYLDKYPALKEIKESVFAIPEIAAYIEKREKTFI